MRRVAAGCGGLRRRRCARCGGGRACSANSRGFSVWHTAPRPMIAYQHSMCLYVFHAMVATTSPDWMPSRCSARARSLQAWRSQWPSQ